MIDSQVLKSNPLKDPAKRHNYILVPNDKKPLPVVVHLSGYFGNGTQATNIKCLEENFPQMIQRLTEEKKIPRALHCFVDAMTAVGGSQFINSSGCGRYSDYIQTELVTALKKTFKTTEEWTVAGASSGGYGALHHISLAKTAFTKAVVVAPDSFFETSLLPDFYKTAPWLENLTTVKELLIAIQSGELKKNKNYFYILNAAAMAMNYAPVKGGKISYPIHVKSGELIPKTWQDYQKKDPIQFLRERNQHLKGKYIRLAVGQHDDFALYFGARKIKQILELEAHLDYTEFQGGHNHLNSQVAHLLGK
ncbi:MAG: esterase family protein [Bdellovibrionales bacterium]|nr:esterase family protein [Bdellovibrionales bacterium]